MPGYTEASARKLHERVVPFTAGDGLQCNLIHVGGERPPSKGPVLLVHGAGVRANIFRAPVETTLVDVLVERGYDVWLENWRASIDLPPNLWTLDQAAVHDHPFAVRKVILETGAPELKAVIHCQGSTSFMMSAVAGLVPQVTTIVSNAVSLHPVVPFLSELKGFMAVPLVSLFTRYLNPQWGLRADGVLPKVIKAFVELTHYECDNAVCKQVSFVYGFGFPTLWRHENLNEETHEWVKQEFAHVPMRFFRQMERCLRKGRLVSVEGFRELPADFGAQPPRTLARFAFLAGERNECFLPESQERTYDFFQQQRRGYHSLKVLPGYGHLDMFMGKNAARDVFPIILQELERPAAGKRMPLPPGIGTAREATAGISFRETMAGLFALGETDPRAGARKGRVDGTRLAMHAAVGIADLWTFLFDPQHRGGMNGEIDFSPFGQSIPAFGGTFQLFAPGDEPKLRWMVYELAFEHGGKRYYLAGKKEVRAGSIFRLWPDTTTLYTRLHEGRDASGPVVGAGVLTLGVGELLKLLYTLRATDCESFFGRLRSVGAFFGFFMKELWRTYIIKE